MDEHPFYEFYKQNQSYPLTICTDDCGNFINSIKKITFEGLEEQMLVDVIKNEEPEVEEQRDSLII